MGWRLVMLYRSNGLGKTTRRMLVAFQRVSTSANLSAVLDFQDVVQILDVPDRTFILFHVANFPHDVEGCIGLGSRFNSDALEPAVYDSRVTVAEFFLQAGKSFDLKIQGVRAEL